MRDDEWLYRGRLGRFVEELVVPHLYPRRHALDVVAWPVPDEPVPFADAAAQDYEPFAVGSPWGRAWSTVWFRITGRVPQDWLDARLPVEVVVDLGFRREMEGGQAEGLAFRPDGTILKAIEPFNRYLPVEDPAGGIDVFLEAAANPEVAVGGSWHPTPYSSKSTVPDAPLYVLRQVDVAVRDDTVHALAQDIEVLAGLVEELPPDLPRRAAIVTALNRAMDAVDPVDVAGTAAAARAVLAPVLAAPAYASAHRIVATGHAHIDSAWLWPVRETVRKCARTFANVIDLLDQYDDMVFSCSSAQQYAWIQEHHPPLWDRLKEKVAEGRFVPVGGMWVESDTNMPGSEALARQLIMGKQFFMTEFGVEPEDVWLPDSFGYTGAMPQIAAAAGSRWFLTQKMSWNETNELPHHTFLWEGIDGTRIFTHFPPVDTYNSRLAAFELAKAERQYKESGHGSVSLVPFGYGDGGGGPTREMVERAHRTADLEGSPRVRIGTVREFFADAEAELPSPAVWSGEMYLETHRGTYTSQLRTKQGNRRSEHLLRAAEVWATTAAVRAGVPYPADEMREAWRTVLLQQFHDILPGSSIAWVHREAEAHYARVAEVLEGVVERSLVALAGEGDRPLVVNSSPVAMAGVAPLSVAAADGGQSSGVTLTPRDAGGWVVDNGVLRVTVDADGLLPSVVDLATGREAVSPGRRAGLLQLHHDRPSMYEAWDIDAHIGRTVTDVTAADDVRLVRDDGASAVLEVTRRFRASTVRQRIEMSAGSRAVDLRFDVDWHEQRTLLKLAFPVDVLADRAASEIQFGHVFRPTHANTSWDMARYETCAHRWVHVGEPGFGVAVANDSTYGHDIRRDAHEAGTGTTIRLSLVRGPRFPDPDTDQGRHHLAVTLVVGTDIDGAIAHGQRLNQPLRTRTGSGPVPPLLEVAGDGVLIETVKPAEDGSGDVVVRLYEALGRRAGARVRPAFRYGAVVETDLLERPVAPRALSDDGDGGGDGGGDGFALRLRPFQIVTLRFTGVAAA